MANRRRTSGLSRLRWKSQSSAGARWPLVALAAVVAVLGVVMIRSFMRQDDWVRWSHALEQQTAGFTWPRWNPEWPPLPPSRTPHADVTGPYAFAALHSADLRYIPCFCGCGRQGHHSNADCYLKAVTPSGLPTWDDHSFTCTTCVNVTREVALMSTMGRSLLEIRREIDAHHSGPATPTPQVPTGEMTP